MINYSVVHRVPTSTASASFRTRPADPGTCRRRSRRGCCCAAVVAGSFPGPWRRGRESASAVRGALGGRLLVLEQQDGLGRQEGPGWVRRGQRSLWERWGEGACKRCEDGLLEVQAGDAEVWCDERGSAALRDSAGADSRSRRCCSCYCCC